MNRYPLVAENNISIAYNYDRCAYAATDTNGVIIAVGINAIDCERNAEKALRLRAKIAAVEAQQNA